MSIDFYPYNGTGSMALYELAVFDPFDPVLDLMWKQGT